MRIATLRRLITYKHVGSPAPVVFMFPGQGSQFLHMAAELYATDASFRADVDYCCDVLKPHLDRDLRTAIYPQQTSDDTRRELNETRFAQPALFVMEYALARLWMRWNIIPAALIGHSVGEFAAACLAGVMSVEDALAIVAARGRMMQQVASGCMLSVLLGEDELAPLLTGSLALAAVNSPQLSVLSGPTSEVEQFEKLLDARGVAYSRLATSHAFHSAMMDSVVEPFTEYLRRFQFQPPRMPLVSGVTGEWMTASEATDPVYWVRQFRETVQFSRGIRTLQQVPQRFYLEVGPGGALTTFARLHRDAATEMVAVTSLPDPVDSVPDSVSLCHAAGMLWLHGVAADWQAVHGGAARRCSLPTYPFERKRFWIERLPSSEANPPVEALPSDAATTPIETITEIPLQTVMLQAPHPRLRTALKTFAASWS